MNKGHFQRIGVVVLVALSLGRPRIGPGRVARRCRGGEDQPAQRDADGGLLLRPRQRGCPRRPLCQGRGAGRWQHEGGPGGLRPHHPAPQDRAGGPTAHRAADRHSRRPRHDLRHAHAYRSGPVAGLRTRQPGWRQQRPGPKIHAGIAQPDRPGRGRGERQAQPACASRMRESTRTGSPSAGGSG